MPKTNPFRRRPRRALLARLLALLQSGKDVRQRKVRRVRAAVRASRYENDLKVSIAADRLLNELAE
ncbi:MAG TPA: hypothetical protein VG269_18910 [Tepidisphaeraceae bacterium]|jgi:hypothetical protein|nr:hypothetical protein [Tepidisphaeraceae bacterium]